jgi:hypothetical protein
MLRFVSLALLFISALAQQGDQSGTECRFTLPSSSIFDLNDLKMTPNNPHRFYDSATLYKINFCGVAACSTVGAQPTPGCKQTASAASGTGESAIGSYSYGVQKADMNQNDIVDINFKTKGMPTFNMDAKGIKIYYPAAGTMGQPMQGQGQPGQAGFGGQPQQPGAAPQGPQQPAAGGWGATPAPAPPAGDGQWPGGRRLMQFGQTQQPQQPQQPGMPGQQTPMPGLPKNDADPLTVFVICNAAMTGNAAPVIFAPGMQYRTRQNGHMFVMEHAAGCPVEENFIERAAGGLGWGWTFVICFAVLLVLYCGCGIFYKIKKQGVTGIEAIPNIEFWRDFPTLVKEGCNYSIATALNCVGKGGGYTTV